MIREDPLCNDDATVLCDSRAIILIKYLLTKPRYAIRIVSVDSIIWQSWACNIWPLSCRLFIILGQHLEILINFTTSYDSQDIARYKARRVGREDCSGITMLS